MMLLGVYVSRREESRAAIFFKPDGVKRRTRIARMWEHERWDLVFVPACIVVPWQRRPEQRELWRLVVRLAEADQGVAPVIVTPAIPRGDPRRCVTKRDLAKCGMHKAKVLHHDRCREGELWQKMTIRQRVCSRAVPEAEVQRPEAREEMYVSEPKVRLTGPPARPAPTCQEGGSSGSGSGANEVHAHEHVSKRGEFAES